jgi:hypothetical protein
MSYVIIINDPYEIDEVNHVLGPFDTRDEAIAARTELSCKGAHPDSLGGVLPLMCQTVFEKEHMNSRDQGGEDEDEDDDD